MEFFENVKIPVFGANAEPAQTLVSSESQINGKYYTDTQWLNESNYTRLGGVVEGIARSTDYNTVLRQCSVMSSTLANILAYRNSIARTGLTPYGGSTNTNIGTELIGSETTIDGHIGNLVDIFSSQNFLFDGEVTTRTLASNSVTTAKIVDGAVTTAKVGDDQITKAKLGSDLILTGSAESNGITVSLSQGVASTNHGLVIGLSVNSNGVSKAVNATTADKSDLVNTSTNSTQNLYLCGTTTTAPGYKGLSNTSNVYISNGSQVNANSFNALSDVRLKENIVDVGKHQVKDLVENTDVKLYNYKTTPNETTIGLIAQDIKKSNSPLADLLVFEASPEDGLLGIHESKLVYVLWNYVQQQHKEIEELKKLIKKLED